MISSTTASTPPPPPPPVSTTVVCSRSTSSRSSAIGNSPSLALLSLRNEPARERFRMVMPRYVWLAILALAACGRGQPQDAAKGNGSLLIPKEAQPVAPPPPAPHPPSLAEPTR